MLDDEHFYQKFVLIYHCDNHGVIKYYLTAQSVVIIGQVTVRCNASERTQFRTVCGSAHTADHQQSWPLSALRHSHSRTNASVKHNIE